MVDSPWLTPALVVAWMEDVEQAEPVTNRPALQDACNAAALYVEEIHPEEFVTPDPPPDPPVPVYTPRASFLLGAIMLAARLYARRGTVLGVAGFSEFGASPILRYDPDIQRLLKIGAFGSFVFGAPTLPVEEEEEEVVVP